MKTKKSRTGNKHESDLVLPHSDELNIAALSKLFGKTTNSYKFLFFLSILDILKTRDFHDAGQISYFDLTVEMLTNAWLPHTDFICRLVPKTP